MRRLRDRGGLEPGQRRWNLGEADGADGYVRCCVLLYPGRRIEDEAELACLAGHEWNHLAGKIGEFDRSNNDRVLLALDDLEILAAPLVPCDGHAQFIDRSISSIANVAENGW